MKTLKEIAVLLFALLASSIGLIGFLHNLYQIAAFTESFGFVLLRAVGVILFPLGILLGFL